MGARQWVAQGVVASCWVLAPSTAPLTPPPTCSLASQPGLHPAPFHPCYLCRNAPDSNLCTDACKSQLAKLPDRCLERLADSVAAQGNANVTARLSDQLEACGRNITITNAAAALGARGALLVPLLVLALSLVVAELLFHV